MRALVLTLLLGLAPPTAVLAAEAPASAAARVSIDGPSGAAIDPTYATELAVSGAGFQAVEGGHGGVYVFFGTVSSGWRPSQGGATGRDYFYVPDSEGRDNAGYQRFVAFPGSDTAGSANGGTMSGAGGWSTTLKVPGAVFEAVDRSGGVHTVDCREVTCGIITIGAHGVVNANNETFTPVRVEDLYGGEPPGEAPGAGEQDVSPGRTAPDADTPVRLGPVRLEVDRASATAGHTLSFAAGGLLPRSQVTAILDDGLAAAGPFLVGDDGRVTGVVTLPTDLPAGTHELRLFGGAKEPTVRFAVTVGPAAEPVGEPAAVVDEAAPGEGSLSERLGVGFFGGAVVVLAVALARLVVVRRRQARG